MKTRRTKKDLGIVPGHYDGIITRLIRDKANKEGIMLIYDFIYELYDPQFRYYGPLPANIIGILVVNKICLECENIPIPESIIRPDAFRPVLDEEVPWNRKEQVKYMFKIYGKRNTYIMDKIFLEGQKGLREPLLRQC